MRTSLPRVLFEDLQDAYGDAMTDRNVLLLRSIKEELDEMLEAAHVEALEINRLIDVRNPTLTRDRFNRRMTKAQFFEILNNANNKIGVTAHIAADGYKLLIIQSGAPNTFLSSHRAMATLNATFTKYNAWLNEWFSAQTARINAANEEAARIAKRAAFNRLALSWSVSRGRDTYGYNICRLDDRNMGERFTCCGGGYDMIGTVFARWLCANYQDKLLAIKDQAHYQILLSGRGHSEHVDALYGMTYHEKDNRVHIDGACGIDCVLNIARVIGLEVERDYISTGKRRGETTGWFITETKAN